MDGYKKYRILQVHNYYQIPGGEDTVVANEKKLLEDHGHIVIQYSRNNNELNEFSIFKKILLPFTTIFNPDTYRDIKRIITKESIDIVHVHNTLSLISPAVYYASVKCNVPVVQTMHNFRLLCPGATFYRDGHICEDCVKNGLYCAIKYKCYRGSRLQTFVCVISTCIHRLTGIYGKINYICLTEFNKKKLLMLKYIKEDKVFVKPNFTFDADFVKNSGEYYLFIGRIEKIKGVPLLIEAFSQMSDKQLILAGTGSGLDFYKQEVQRRGIANIEFIGFVGRKRLSQLLNKAKAVVVVSQWYETFGMIVIEAFASHTPVIVGDIGNIGSLIDDEVDGIKFKYNSSDELIKAVKRFEELDATVLGENAYQKYVKDFEKRGNYKNIKDTYAKIQMQGTTNK